MIYLQRPPEEDLAQGDIINDCPLMIWRPRNASGSDEYESSEGQAQVVIITQACDLANRKATRVQVAIVHPASSLVQAGILKRDKIREQIRRHQVYGWYFLPAKGALPESLVDLRDIHTIPRALLEHLVRTGRRVTSIATPYREHLAQHFAVTYSRIALPEPYETLPD